MKRTTLSGLLGLLAVAALSGAVRAQWVTTKPAPDKKADAAASTVAPAAAASAAPEVDPALRAKIAALVEKLSSGASADREAAAADLRALGPKAIPLLKEAAETTKDPEVKSQLTGAASDLSEIDALQPTMITLDLQNASPKDWCAAINKQTTFPVTGWPDWYMNDDRSARNNGMKPVTIKIDNQPFWLAMAEIAKQQPMAPMNQNQGNNKVQLQIGADGLKLGPHVSVGPIVLTARTITRHYETRLGDKPEDAQVTKYFNISFMYLMDPKANIMHDTGKMRLEKAEDDKGNSLLPPAPQTTAQLNWWGLSSEQAMPLIYPDNPGTKLAVVKGMMTVDVETLAETIELKNLEDTGGVHNFVGAQLTVTDISKQGDNYSVEVKGDRGSMSQDKWQRISQFGNNSILRVELIDDQGQKMNAQGFGGSSGGNSFTHNYNFSGRDYNNNNKKFGEPKMVRISATAKTKTVEIPFEFKDLPLP